MSGPAPSPGAARSKSPVRSVAPARASDAVRNERRERWGRAMVKAACLVEGNATRAACYPHRRPADESVVESPEPRVPPRTAPHPIRGNFIRRFLHENTDEAQQDIRRPRG